VYSAPRCTSAITWEPPHVVGIEAFGGTCYQRRISTQPGHTLRTISSVFFRSDSSNRQDVRLQLTSHYSLHLSFGRCPCKTFRYYILYYKTDNAMNPITQIIRLGGKLSKSVFGNNLFGSVTHVITTRKIAALTFDDGPHPEYTPKLLDILHRNNAKATFFIIGKNAERYPNLIKQIADGGHAICNHSWDHRSFPQLTSAERRSQIRKCANALSPYGTKLFRPPYGNQNLSSRIDALMLGYDVVICNVIAEDWLDHDPDWMVNKVLNEIKPGSILLFHDMLYTYEKPEYQDRNNTLLTVEELLDRLDDYSFLTVPDLMKNGKPQRILWQQHGNTKWLNGLNKYE
jgi:peptidoglycan-N-acetylglucosamine deacetylase